MSAATQTLSAPPETPVGRRRIVPSPIPFRRIIGIEFRKMFDTRSGFWLMVSIVLASVLATAAVVIFAPDEMLTYETFATAIGVPVSVVLPIIAALSVTSEWSQRSALTTFTLVPGRGRVVAAKAICTVVVGVVAMVIAATVGALGNVVGTTIAGVDTVWDFDLWPGYALLSLASVLGMAIGFTLGVVLRSSAAAVVGYFVFSGVLPTISGALAASQEWYRDIAGWVDLNTAIAPLYDDIPTGEQWAQLGVTSLVWLVIPLAIGLRFLLRSEIK